jgi:hypothetical protein
LTGERRTAEEIVALQGEALRRYEERLARALASVINVLDPDVIVLGGGMSNAARLYTEVPRLWSRHVFDERVEITSDGRVLRLSGGHPAALNTDTSIFGTPRLFHGSTSKASTTTYGPVVMTSIIRVCSPRVNPSCLKTSCWKFSIGRDLRFLTSFTKRPSM